MQMNYSLMLIEQAIGVHANNDLVTLVLAAVVLSTCIVLMASSYPHSRHLPPGPRRLPVLGNIHLLPAEYQQQTFAEWGRKYGMHLLICYMPVHKHTDLLPRRGAGICAIFQGARVGSQPRACGARVVGEAQCEVFLATIFHVSSRDVSLCIDCFRHSLTMLWYVLWTDVSVQWDHAVRMPYSDRWRKHRRWLQNTLLTRSRLVTYEPILQGEVRGLLRDIIRSPEDILTHVKR